MGPLFPLEDALLVVDRSVRPVAGRESVPLASAAGRVLAESVRSDVDAPPFDRSAVDGYAVRSRDLARVPAMLRVDRVVAAGDAPGRSRLGPALAARIFTGAPVPAGADAVVMQEATRGPERPVVPGDLVMFLERTGAGKNVSPRAEHLRRGSVPLRPGTLVGPPEIAVLASVGKTIVSVLRRVRVALLATGDELVPPGSRPAPGRLRNSNTLAARAAFEGLPVETTDLGIVGDDAAALERLVRRGLEHDVLVLSGGVSVGDRDLVLPALRAAGVRIHFHGLKLKPAKPTLFGGAPGGRAFAVGLPGNPVSSFVAAELIAKRVVKRLAGCPVKAHSPIAARSAEALPPGGSRAELRPARVEVSPDGRLVARPVPFRGSADFPGLLAADAFIVRPVGARAVRKGGAVRVHLLPGRGILA